MAKNLKQSTTRTKRILSETDQSFDISLLQDKITLRRIPFKARILSLKDASGYSLLHHAADLGCPDVLELLLAKRGKPSEIHFYTSVACMFGSALLLPHGRSDSYFVTGITCVLHWVGPDIVNKPVAF